MPISIIHFFFFVFVDFDFREDDGAFLEEEDDFLEDFSFDVFDREEGFDFMELLLDDEPLRDLIDPIIFSDVLLSLDK